MMSVPFPSFTYRFSPEVTPSYYAKLLDFIYTQYLLPQKQRFTDITRESTSQGERLTYVVTDSQGNRLVNVEVRSGTPFELGINPITSVASHTTVEEAKQDILIAMQIFSQNARNATVFFAWREGEEIVPEAYTKPEKSFNRLFLETQILFFVVFIVFGMLIFITIASAAPDAFWIAPLILIGIQFLFVFYSNRFIARSADWHITKANPIIHLLEYYLPVSEKNDFNKIYTRETLIAIKKEIYEEIIAKNGQVDAGSAQKSFSSTVCPVNCANLKAKKLTFTNL